MKSRLTKWLKPLSSTVNTDDKTPGRGPSGFERDLVQYMEELCGT